MGHLSGASVKSSRAWGLSQRSEKFGESPRPLQCSDPSQTLHPQLLGCSPPRTLQSAISPGSHPVKILESGPIIKSALGLLNKSQGTLEANTQPFTAELWSARSIAVEPECNTELYIPWSRRG